MSDKSMHGATHIKTRSGVYQYDRRVPKHVREAFASLTPERLAQLPHDINAYFNQNTHIRYSLGTSDKKRAKTLGNQADFKFDGLVSRFDAWLAQGAQTYDVVDADTVRALAQLWVRKELQLDEERRLDPEQAFFLEHHEIAMYHMEPDYQALLALGGADKRDAHVVKTGDDLLREYQIRLDPQSSSYALLHRELVMGLLKVYEVAKLRNAGRVMSTHQAPEVDLSHLLKEPSNRQATHHSNVPAAPRRQAQHVAQPGGVPTLGELVDDYVHALKENEFKRKVRRALQLFAAVIGRKTYVNEIRQKEVTAYLHKICLLPVNWSRRYDKGETVAKILTSVGDAECFSPTTFESNYRSTLGAFFLNSLRDYRDVGFPSLTVDGIEYKGLRKAEENKQRALSVDELKTLIEGPEFLAIANDRNRESLYWLTLVAFFLGASSLSDLQIVSKQQLTFSKR